MSATPERLIIESMFRIADKDGQDVDFKLNVHQAQLDSELTGRDIVPKARQLGMSSYVLGRYTAKCLYKRNTRAVVISHDKESTQKMLAKVHYILNNLKGPAAQTKLANRNEITFPRTNSAFYIGTAGARQFGRGDTITDLHCSEVAFWPDPKKLTAGLFQAVPRSGEIILESTGNGVGNYYHRSCMNAYEGKGRFKLHFFNWLKNHEYWVSLTEDEKTQLKDSLKEDWDEPDLFYNTHLSLGQIAWRREKLEELDYDLRIFAQEYPITLDECFQSTGYSIFTNINYERCLTWTEIERGFWVDAEALKSADRSEFAIGVDVSAGVNRDRSVVTVIDLIQNRQVAEYVTDTVPPDMLAYKIKYIGELFNSAFVTVESNNHGGMTLMKLRDIYPRNNLYTMREDTDRVMQYGYRTTAKTKPLILNNFRREFTDGFRICSPALKDELSTFVETEEGKLEAEAGCFDDRVMAMAVGLMGARKAHLKDIISASRNKQSVIATDPFSLDAILEEFGKKGRFGPGYPIPTNIRTVVH